MTQPADDGDEEAGPRVKGRHLPAKEPEKEDEGDLVDHRRRDEEGERDAQGDAGGDEADKERDGRAGAERRDDAEERREDVAGRLTPAGQHAPGALGREERADDADAENDDGEQEQDLGGLENEELHGGR